MQATYETYTLEQGLVDIQRYDQETCNLNVGLNELRASLIVGPDVKRPNNPILPLPPQSLFPGVGPMAPPPQFPDGLVPHGPGGSAGAGTVKPPPITGSGPAKKNLGIPGTDRIGSAQGDVEKNITKAEGSRIQRGLCLPENVEPDSFGPITREAIRLFRQTSAEKRLFPLNQRSSGGLSSEEATVLENRSCDIGCYKNAYERYQFDEQENKGAVDNLMTLLNGVETKYCSIRDEPEAYL